MKGHGVAYGAGTVINAIAAWKGCAFGIDLKTEATVQLRGDLIEGEIEGGGDTRLIERACELTLDNLCIDSGAKIRTTSGIPVASGLKSSSAAANATVLATARAAGRDIDPLEAVRIGVQAALDAGVSITGAFDDACASMFGGVVLTDNKERKLLKRERLESEVVIYVPDRKAFSAQTDVRRSRLVAPWVEMAFDLASQRRVPQGDDAQRFPVLQRAGIQHGAHDGGAGARRRGREPLGHRAVLRGARFRRAGRSPGGCVVSLSRQGDQDENSQRRRVHP